MAEEAERTALYELYDAAGALLYVGISNRPMVRFASHAHEKTWWPEVATRAISWYETREAAAAAEVEAIRTRQPRYNKALPDENGVYRLVANRSPWSPTPEQAEILDCLASITSPVERTIEIGRQLQAILTDQKRLAAMRRTIINDMRAKGMSLAQIGAELGVAGSRVQQISAGKG